MRISDWSSDVCSSDLAGPDDGRDGYAVPHAGAALWLRPQRDGDDRDGGDDSRDAPVLAEGRLASAGGAGVDAVGGRSEEHTSELQSLMRISYAVFCLKKKNKINKHRSHIRS